MKILSIKEPRQLDDGTVKASITVSDDNFIPLIVLIKDAREGAEIDLDVRKSDNEPEHDSIWEFAQMQARALEKRLRAEREIGQKEGIDMSRSLYIIGNPEIVHESPERQADVVKAHDKVEDNKSPYAPATDRY